MGRVPLASGRPRTVPACQKKLRNTLSAAVSPLKSMGWEVRESASPTREIATPGLAELVEAIEGGHVARNGPAREAVVNQRPPAGQPALHGRPAFRLTREIIKKRQRQRRCPVRGRGGSAAWAGSEPRGRTTCAWLRKVVRQQKRQQVT